jgi:hypothetical protein
MILQADYEAYQARVLAGLKELLNSTGTRPVLFVGCGISRRYLGAPSWLELLRTVADMADMDEASFNFLSQKANNDPGTIGSLLVDPVHEWAWSKGKNVFPADYFQAGLDKSIFLKHLAAEHLKTFKQFSDDPKNKDEIDLLKRCSPHAIITTNFDTVLENLFEDFEVVLGERIIPMAMSIVGELYKIHGSVSDPSTLVLTHEDYDRFGRKRKYISSKMMTYFAEYPVIILGYGLGDSNINSIISDLGEAMREKGGLLDNVYYVEWVPDVLALSHLKEEHVVPGDPGESPLRLRAVVTTDLGWFLKGLADVSSPVPVNLKVLRHLASRVIDLVRHDVAKNNVELDYKKIEHLTDDKGALGMLLGISNISNPNVGFPYLLSQVAKKLGYDYWGSLTGLIAQANDRIGYDIKKSDNEFHFAFKSGSKSETRKYSEKMVDLLKLIKEENAKNAPK